MFYQTVLCVVEQDGLFVNTKGKNGEICSSQGTEICLAVHLLYVLIATTQTHKLQPVFPSSNNPFYWNAREVFVIFNIQCTVQVTLLQTCSTEAFQRGRQ